MADVQAQSQAEQSERLGAWVQERSTMLMWALLVIGALLVLSANGIGEAVVKNCMPNGGCSWNPEDARQAALTCRSLGGLSFAAGLVERLVICLRGLGRSAA